MKRWSFGRGAFGVCAAATLLASCAQDRAQPPLAAASASNANAGPTTHDTGYEKLYSFKGPPDGEQPEAGLSYYDGRFYGTTSLGGFTGSGCNACGTVYRVDADGREKVIYRFAGAPDGAYPESDLAEITRHEPFFLGTTYSGGTGCSGSCGTVFRITPDGREHVLYSFKGGEDGSNPRGGLLVLNGDLYYGTTTAGGAQGDGTVYAVQNSGEERVLHSFQGGTSDGVNPVGDLVLLGSTLYGVTQTGGADNAGTVFKIGTSGGDESVVHSFSGESDGKNPVGIVAWNGKLYGTTSAAGALGKGTVFELNPGNGDFRVIRQFRGHPDDGAYPQAPPIFVEGVMYGNTRGGGMDGNGTVYRLTVGGREKILYSFHRVPDGVSPYAPMTLVDGMLYGTTLYGGSTHYSALGTVYRLNL